MKTPLAASSSTDCKAQPLLFQDLGSRQVVADFSGGTLSSDGGVLLLRQVDANLGLTSALARCFEDRREPVYVDHSVQRGTRTGSSLNIQQFFENACNRIPIRAAHPKRCLSLVTSTSTFNNRSRRREETLISASESVTVRLTCSPCCARDERTPSEASDPLAANTG